MTRDTSFDQLRLQGLASASHNLAKSALISADLVTRPRLLIVTINHNEPESLRFLKKVTHSDFFVEVRIEVILFCFCLPL